VNRASDKLSQALSGAAFVALALLVATGAVTGLDQWACDHLMPLAGRPVGGPPSLLESLVPLYHAAWHPVGAAVTQIVTLPGQVVVSFVLVVICAWKLRAPLWVAAWAGAVGLELALRHLLTRPALFRGGVHVTAFDSSWPSGHALRCAIVAAAIAAAWPRARVAAAAWLVASVLLLELAGFHTPTDVLGGLLLAGVAVRGVVAARALRQA
jgi:membrane-associated phospholipid phosphatase